MTSFKLGSYCDGALLDLQERYSLLPESCNLKEKNFSQLRRSWYFHNIKDYGYSRQNVNIDCQIDVHGQLGAYRKCSIEDMLKLEVINYLVYVFN